MKEADALSVCLRQKYEKFGKKQNKKSRKSFDFRDFGIPIRRSWRARPTETPEHSVAPKTAFLTSGA